MCGHRWHRGRERTSEDWTPQIDEMGASAASEWGCCRWVLACSDMIWVGMSVQLGWQFLGERGDACFVGEESHGDEGASMRGGGGGAPQGRRDGEVEGNQVKLWSCGAVE